MKVVIISSSIRVGRLSHRVALFLERHLQGMGVEAQVLDLKAYDFPLFEQRYIATSDPTDKMVDFVRKFTEADGVIIVSPVYNASFPAALKNIVDFLVGEWQNKPVGVVSVTYGMTPGIQTVQQIQALLLKMGARVAAPCYTVIEAGSAFDESGVPSNAQLTEKFSSAMIRELIWLIDKSIAN